MAKSPKVSDAIEVLKDLERNIDERIVDMHGIKGLQQSRHAYCYYRTFVWKAIRLLESNKDID